MAIDDSTVDNIKQISIRGRFAIVLTCFKLLLREQGLIQDPFYRTLVAKIGSFTQADKLDIWEAQIQPYYPAFQSSTTDIIEQLNQLNRDFQKQDIQRRDDWYHQASCDVLTENFYQALITFYHSPCSNNSNIIKVYDACYEIGTAELYGQMSSGNSQITLDIVQDILTTSHLSHEFNFAKIARQYPFDEERGWGRTFDFQTFQRK